MALLWAPATGEETRRKLGERRAKAATRRRGRAPGPRVPAQPAGQPDDGVRAGQGSLRAGPGAEGDGVNDWAPVFLGVIARRTLVMAAIQVGAIIYGARAAQRLEQMLGRVEKDIKPVLERRHGRSREDAARMSALATVAGRARRPGVQRPVAPRRTDRRGDPAGDGHAGARRRGARSRAALDVRRAARPARQRPRGAAARASKKTTRSSSAERAARERPKENGGDARATNGHGNRAGGGARRRSGGAGGGRGGQGVEIGGRRPRRWPSSWRRPSCSTSPPRIRPTLAASSPRCTCPARS